MKLPQPCPKCNKPIMNYSMACGACGYRPKDKDPRCSTCRYYHTEDSKFHKGGFCHWRAPMVLRGVVWGAHNERIVNPDEEYCSEHATNAPLRLA